MNEYIEKCVCEIFIKNVVKFFVINDCIFIYF